MTPCCENLKTASIKTLFERVGRIRTSLHERILPPGSRIARILHGPDSKPSTYLFSSWLFPRLMGLVALVALLSYWSQAEGLIGENGILPFNEDLQSVAKHCANNPDSPSKSTLRPTLLWYWDAPDNSSLRTIFICGTAGCILAMLGILPPLSLGMSWICYLSLYSVGGPFLRFQWDILLLEALFLAILACGWTLFDKPDRHRQMPNIARWLLWLLLFKLIFESGLVKLTWFGPEKANAWRDLTALRFHYWTQPIPAWASWHIHQLPEWFDRLSLRLMMFVELVLPFLFFLPRRLRHFAFLGQVVLQLLIILSGNYGFFNLLTIILCIPLLDDQCMPGSLVEKFRNTGTPGPAKNAIWIIRHVAIIPIAILHLWLGYEYLKSDFEGNQKTKDNPMKTPSPEWQRKLRQKAQAWHLVNSYGLFRVMTITRPEIEISGSLDGKDWRSYKFRWKPGATDRRPAFFFPHMPRLDWQMWFAALQVEGYGFRASPPWLIRFIKALSEQRTDALALLDENPFPEKPPRFIRLRLHQYTFTTYKELKETDNWWTRRLLDRHTIVLPVRP